MMYYCSSCNSFLAQAQLPPGSTQAGVVIGLVSILVDLSLWRTSIACLRRCASFRGILAGQPKPSSLFPN